MRTAFTHFTANPYLTPEARERFRDRMMRDIALKSITDPERQAKMDSHCAAIMARNGTLEWFARQARARMEGAR